MKRICRCVDGVNVGIYNLLLTVNLFYCYRLRDFDYCLFRICLLSRVDICSLYRGLLYVVLGFWIVY